MLNKIQPYAKFVAALIGTAVTAGGSLLLPEALEWLTFIGALITTVAVYAVPNVPAAKAPYEDGEGLFQ